jgi:threonine/homoserine/homoserine lactone efflux protein
MPDFVPELPIILSFAVASFVLCVTPGPDMALSLSKAIQHGRAHGLASMSGALSGVMVHTALVAFGISILIATAPTAFLALKTAGAVYLLWLAVQAIRSKGGLSLDTARGSAPAPSLWASFWTGVGINLLNPKIVLFFVTFLPQFVSRDDPAATGKLLFLGAEFIIVSVPPAFAIVLAAGAVANLFARSIWTRRIVNWSFAGVFAAFAALILTTHSRAAT